MTADFGPGAHDWAYWDARIQDVLAWLPLTAAPDAAAARSADAGRTRSAQNRSTWAGQLRLGPAVVQDDVRHRPPLLVGRLGSHAGAGVVRGQPALDEPGHPRLRIGLTTSTRS